MRIIKKGVPPTHKFTCHICGTVFEAEGAEFKTGLNRENGKSEYVATCPICGRKVLDEGEVTDGFKCSRCGHFEQYKKHYCENCGAKMEA